MRSSRRPPLSGLRTLPAERPTTVDAPKTGAQQGQVTEPAALPGAREPQGLLERTLSEWGGQQPLWVFAYASLLWKREFDIAEYRPARVMGWHRAFRMRSGVNRGTPEVPGLVFALMAGGSCAGAVFRLPAHDAHATLCRLWQREMPTGVYEPRWLRCQTAQGPVSALAFTLDRQHPAHLGSLDDPAMLQVLRHARGRYGSTLDYLLRTAESLDSLGIRDREIRRLVALARQHGLHQDP